jgi:hypothetical protein
MDAPPVIQRLTEPGVTGQGGYPLGDLRLRIAS